MTINIIKLSSGEQIVTEVLEFEDLSIQVKDPLLLIKARDGSGNHFIDHWLPVYSGSFVISLNNDTVITCVPADDWLINFYNKMLNKFHGEEPVTENTVNKQSMPEEFFSKAFVREGSRERRLEEDKTKIVSNKETYH